MNESAADFELVAVQAGVFSLRSRIYRETFHPVVGPIAEARALHVEQPCLLKRAEASRHGPFIIWDVGLGAAANAIAVIEALSGRTMPASIELHSFDRNTAALEFALQHADELGYFGSHNETARLLLSHGTVSVAPMLWTLHLADFCAVVAANKLPAPHAILYDPYSPRANPDMWILDHFLRLRACCMDGESACLLTSTTRSTAVRVTLLLAGFFVGRGIAVGEKEETTVAASDRTVLGKGALDRTWLSRLNASTASAPLRAGAPPSRIQPQDLAALERHPQFASS